MNKSKATEQKKKKKVEKQLRRCKKEKPHLKFRPRKQEERKKIASRALTFFVYFNQLSVTHLLPFVFFCSSSYQLKVCQLIKSSNLYVTVQGHLQQILSVLACYVSPSASQFQNASISERFPPPYKECFILLSNRCEIS